MKGLPGFHGAEIDDAFRRAADRDVDQAVLDVIAGQTDGMGCGGTCRTGREGRAFDAIFDADVGGRRRSDDAQQRQRIGRFIFQNEKIAIGAFEGVQTTRARADDAGGAGAVVEGDFEAGLDDCFFGCRGGYTNGVTSFNKNSRLGATSVWSTFAFTANDEWVTQLRNGERYGADVHLR